MAVERHNFHPQFKLHVCAEPKNDKLSFIHFENGYAYVTNGFCAVRAKLDYISTFLPEEIRLLDGKSIGMKEFKILLEYEQVDVTDKGFNVLDDAKPMFFGFNRQLEFKFPDAENLVDRTLNNINSGNSVKALGVNINHLSKLSKAMDVDVFRFDFDGMGAVLVRDNISEINAENMIGIIMPCRVDEEPDTTEK